ncbi:MAG: ribonuclease HII [Candidatus Woesearchaeota archaeon]
MITEYTECGIDEAGRGPVLGPLIVAGVCATTEQIAELAKIGVTDSKLLSPKKREALAPLIKQIVQSYEIREISVQDIDDRIKKNQSLTDLELFVTSDIVQKLKPVKVVIDCPSANKKTYKDSFVRHSSFPGECIVEFKADTNHVVVGAASILAKVKRDECISTIKKQIGIDCGSGYPSDPKTQLFLSEYYLTHKTLFRTSWESYKNCVSQKSQVLLTDM